MEQNICLITYFLTFVNLHQEISGENSLRAQRKEDIDGHSIVKLSVIWTRR